MKTIKQVTATPEFVEFIPEKLEEKIFYISKEYGVMCHLCLCGCGNKTCIPVGDIQTERDWQMIENNGMVTFKPSLLHSQLDCKSHYIITNNVANFV